MVKTITGEDKYTFDKDVNTLLKDKTVEVEEVVFRTTAYNRGNRTLIVYIAHIAYEIKCEQCGNSCGCG